MRVVTLGRLGDVYSVRQAGRPGVLMQRAGYRPSFLPAYDPNMRSRGLGNLPTNTVGGALTYLNEIIARVTDAQVQDPTLTEIEVEAAALAQSLGGDPERKLTLSERMAINKLDDKSYKAVGAWYKTSLFRYGLVGLAIAGGVYVIYRSYR